MPALFSKPKPLSLPAPPPLPKFEDPEVIEARRRARITARKRQGRSESILTSGLGDVSAAPVERKTLLGL